MTEFNMLDLIILRSFLQGERNQIVMNAAYNGKLILQEARGFHTKSKTLAHGHNQYSVSSHSAPIKSSPFTSV